MEAVGIIVVGTENSNSNNNSNNSTHTERQRRLQTGCSPTTNTFSPHSFPHLHNYNNLLIPNSSTRLYAHVVLSASTVVWTWMYSDPRCPRGPKLDTLSLIQSTLLLTETVPIQDPHPTPPHLEVKAWANMVGLEQPMALVLAVAAPYREMAKR